jgi:hypothetical protein
MVLVLATSGVAVLPAGPLPLAWVTAASAPIRSQADPQIAAIQAVIQQAQQDKAQALARGDPSLMERTATGPYYQELVQVDQILVSNGSRASPPPN